MFRSFSFKIIINNKNTLVNYLDVNLDLINDNFRSYQKTNENLKHINAFSNHSFSIKRTLVSNIPRITWKLSYDIQIFENNADII